MDRYPVQKKVNYQNTNFEVIINNKDEESFWENYTLGSWEPETLNFLLDHVRPGWFLDIGSWIGPISLLMASKYDKVISVDFDPLAVENLKKNISVNHFSNIEQINIGLSDVRGKVKLNKKFFGSSVTSLFYQTSDEEGFEVNLITFEDLLKRIGDFGKINVIKIDIEGAEFKIIKSVYKLLNKKKVIVLLSYHPFHLGLFKWRIFRVIHSLKQLRYTKYLFSKSTSIKIIKPYDLVSLIKYKFPLGDVLES